MNDRSSAHVLWLAPQPLVLASGSASRRRILDEASIPYDVHPSQIDERAIEAQTTQAAPPQLALQLARAKALDVAKNHGGRLVLGADQLLSDDHGIVHKAAGRDEAAATLRRLSGRSHGLNAAICLARGDAIVFETVSTAHMTVRVLSEAFIADYLELCGDAILGSVGCYHIEAIGVHLFTAIDGDQWTIRGLPILPLLEFLRDENYLRT
ncbi:Maf family protein [Roseiarcaceae bacterium H3SJ34-1]|uniref:Maf family protein n=1 Tax=Terripilifer ovatus TaxID=3032367 RepID=UPI003AB9330C|nr:Maf family protein [Roseiarcaceae bacterium H3SJ34-1]